LQRVNTGDKNEMRKHRYLTEIDYDLWTDLNRLKKLDNQSINSLLATGARQLIAKRVQEVSQVRKTRETLSNMV